MLRVLVDGRLLADPFNVGRGCGRYILAILGGLADHRNVQPLALLPPGGVVPDGVTPVAMRPLIEEPLDAGRSTWERHVARLGGLVDDVAPDVFHAPAFDPPLVCSSPWVQTLHDIISLRRPGPLYAWERRYWGVRAARYREASAVIAVSNTVASDGVRHLGLDPRRIHVVHHGVAPIFRSDAPTEEADRPYFLFVSAFALHKGFHEAFAAIDRVAAAGLPHVLKVVGAIPDYARSHVEADLVGIAHPERVEFLGHVPDRELARLYRRATALVASTRIEGFGLPLVEAMAAGAPVVAFRHSCIDEITGGAAVLVPDGDVAALAAELCALARDPAARRDLGAAGLRRSAAFSWERSVRRHVDVFESVAARG